MVPQGKEGRGQIPAKWSKILLAHRNERGGSWKNSETRQKEDRMTPTNHPKHKKNQKKQKQKQTKKTTKKQRKAQTNTQTTPPPKKPQPTSLHTKAPKPALIKMRTDNKNTTGLPDFRGANRKNQRLVSKKKPGFVKAG